jgi:hypothetical protein
MQHPTPAEEPERSVDMANCAKGKVFQRKGSINLRNQMPAILALMLIKKVTLRFYVSKRTRMQRLTLPTTTITFCTVTVRLVRSHVRTDFPDEPAQPERSCA